MFTGRVVVKENMTEVVLNEYAESTQFYSLFRAEGLIREMSMAYSNAYMVAIFACSRQKHIAKSLVKAVETEKNLEPIDELTFQIVDSN